MKNRTCLCVGITVWLGVAGGGVGGSERAADRMTLDRAPHFQEADGTALVQGLKNGKADANRDTRVAVGELQGFVIVQVQQLTHGGRNSTARRENLEYDFAIYSF